MARSWPERAGGGLIALALAMLLAGCASAPAGPVLFHPLPPAAEGYELTEGALRFRGGGFEILLRPFDWRLVAERYRRDGLALPFGEGRDIMSAFVFFSLRFENRADGTLLFNPLRVSAFTDRNELLVPVNVTDVYLVRTAGNDAGERARSFQATSYDSSIAVPPDGSIERYLVFPAPGEAVKRLRVVLNDIYLGTSSYSIAFLFEAFPADGVD